MTDPARWPTPWVRAALDLAVLASLTDGPAPRLRHRAGARRPRLRAVEGRLALPGARPPRGGRRRRGRLGRGAGRARAAGVRADGSRPRSARARPRLVARARGDADVDDRGGGPPWLSQDTAGERRIDAFGDARGDDRRTARGPSPSSWRLMMRDVDADQVRDGLEEALALVRATAGVAAGALRDGDEHADALLDQLARRGTAGRSPAAATRLAGGRAARPRDVRGVRRPARAGRVRSGVTSPGRAPPCGWCSSRSPIGMGSSVVHGLWTRRHRSTRARASTPSGGRAWSLELTEILPHPLRDVWCPGPPTSSPMPTPTRASPAVRWRTSSARRRRTPPASRPTGAAAG